MRFCPSGLQLDVWVSGEHLDFTRAHLNLHAFPVVSRSFPIVSRSHLGSPGLTFEPEMQCRSVGPSTYSW